MSNSQTSSRNPRFTVLAVVVLLAAAGAVALLTAPLASAGRGVLYSFAQTAYNHHDYTASLADLKYYQPSSAKSLTLETKANLEQGSGQAAVTAAQRAHRLDPSDQTTTLLLGAAYALGRKQADLTSLIAAERDSKTLQGLRRLATPDIAQAQELYVLGLLTRSQEVLAQIQTPSAQRSVLQAQVALGLEPGKTGALAATPYVKAAVALDPTNIAAQKLDISVSHQTGDSAAADAHRVLLDRLEAGTP